MHGTHSHLVHGTSDPCDGITCPMLGEFRARRATTLDALRAGTIVRAVTSESGGTRGHRPHVDPDPVGPLPEWATGPTAPAPARHRVTTLAEHDDGTTEWTSTLVANGGAIHTLWDAHSRQTERARWNTDAERAARRQSRTRRLVASDLTYAGPSAYIADPDTPDRLFLPTVDHATAAEYESRVIERRGTEALMADDGSAGLLPIGPANLTPEPSIGQAWEAAQVTYQQSPYGMHEDGLLGDVTVTYADGTTETVPADASNATGTRGKGRTVKCATRNGRVDRADACGQCTPCKGRERFNRHARNRRHAERMERAEAVMSAYDRARGATRAARYTY